MDEAFEQTVVSVPLFHPFTPELPTVDPGSYLDRIEIARGGMGRILAARDRRLGRAVAIKELRTDHPTLRARFVREALLTARLSHPSIVSVHEAGVWPSGEPFYAMKLVPGRSLDQVIASAPTLAARLALLPHVLAVADALAYAHQQRVIHRDLKPHNVLVGDFGETVVIDWGLAKDLAAAERDLAAPSSSDDALATTAGDILGTPAYMPPEQASGEPVDERADVYAIGALLYHLLAGRPAYEGNSAVAVLAQVMDEPPRPLAELQPGVPVDLLAIVARAMSRDPAARYADARGLAEDLRRFQSGQLVGAHRYSWRQLLRRWVRRNKRAVGVGSAALAVLIAVAGISVARIVDAEHAAETERAVAVEQRGHAEELMDFMLGDLRDQLRPLNQLALLSRVATKAADYYAHVSDVDPARRARTLHAIGEVLSATGNRAAALATHGQALALDAVAVAVGAPGAVASMASGQLRIADELVQRAQLVDAARLYRAAIANGVPEVTAGAYSKLTDVDLRRGDSDRALADATAALAVWHALAIAEPQRRELRYDLAAGASRLGNVQRTRGDGARALETYRRAERLALALVEAAPGDAKYQRFLSVAKEKVGNALEEQRDFQGALAEQRAALAIRERLSAADPTNAGALRDLAVSHSKVGNLYNWLEDAPHALDEFSADLAIAQRIFDLDRSNLQALRDLAVSHGTIGRSHKELHRFVDAQREMALQVALLSVGVTRSPLDLSWRRDLATSLRFLGQIDEARGAWRTALGSFRVALRQGLALARSNDVHMLRELALDYDDLGRVLHQLRAWTGARVAFATERGLLAALVARDPSDHKSAGFLTETDAMLKQLGYAKPEGLLIEPVLAGS